MADKVDPAQTTLIITGHGTGLNQNSTKAIRDQVDLIAASGAGYAAVLDAYMEEPPFIADWDQLAPTPNVIVVPFFIADGLHSYQDIPVLLGIENEAGPPPASATSSATTPTTSAAKPSIIAPPSEPNDCWRCHPGPGRGL